MFKIKIINKIIFNMIKKKLKLKKCNPYWIIY